MKLGDYVRIYRITDGIETVKTKAFDKFLNRVGIISNECPEETWIEIVIQPGNNIYYFYKIDLQVISEEEYVEDILIYRLEN